MSDIALTDLLKEAGLIASRDDIRASSISEGMNIGQKVVDALRLDELKAGLINMVWAQVKERKLTTAGGAQMLRKLMVSDIGPDLVESTSKCGYMIGELLTAAGIITHRDLLAAIISSELLGQPTGLCLVSRGRLDARVLRKALHIQHDIRAGLTDMTKAAAILSRSMHAKQLWT